MFDPATRILIEQDFGSEGDSYESYEPPYLHEPPEYYEVRTNPSRYVYDDEYVYNGRYSDPVSPRYIEVDKPQQKYRVVTQQLSPNRVSHRRNDVYLVRREDKEPPVVYRNGAQLQNERTVRYQTVYDEGEDYEPRSYENMRVSTKRSVGRVRSAPHSPQYTNGTSKGQFSPKYANVSRENHTVYVNEAPQVRTGEEIVQHRVVTKNLESTPKVKRNGEEIVQREVVTHNLESLPQHKLKTNYVEENNQTTFKNGTSRPYVMTEWNEEKERNGMSSHKYRDIQMSPRGQSIQNGATKRKMKGKPMEKGFLSEVQGELDTQRHLWENEVDRLVGPVEGLSLKAASPTSGEAQGASSYVDTSSGKPVFKAFVNIRGFPAECIDVSVDKLTNKVTITAEKPSGTNGKMLNTFTQKVQLPRFSDDGRMTSRLSKTGMLKLEVPLIYYFEHKKEPKSFVYQVKDSKKTGKQQLEILVNTDNGYSMKDLRVQVEDTDKLIISGVKTDPKTGKTKTTVFKRYTLPPMADVDGITSKFGKEGRLSVKVPLKRASTSSTSSDKHIGK